MSMNESYVYQDKREILILEVPVMYAYRGLFHQYYFHIEIQQEFFLL